MLYHVTTIKKPVIPRNNISQFVITRHDKNCGLLYQVITNLLNFDTMLQLLMVRIDINTSTEIFSYFLFLRNIKQSVSDNYMFVNFTYK